MAFIKHTFYCMVLALSRRLRDAGKPMTILQSYNFLDIVSGTELYGGSQLLSFPVYQMDDGHTFINLHESMQSYRGVLQSLRSHHCSFLFSYYSMTFMK